MKVIYDHHFMLISKKGINCKNKHHVQYHDAPFVIRPIPHGLDQNIVDSKQSDMTVVADAYKPEDDQLLLNDLT